MYRGGMLIHLSSRMVLDDENKKFVQLTVSYLETSFLYFMLCYSSDKDVTLLV